MQPLSSSPSMPDQKHFLWTYTTGCHLKVSDNSEKLFMTISIRTLWYNVYRCMNSYFQAMDKIHCFPNDLIIICTTQQSRALEAIVLFCSAMVCNNLNFLLRHTEIFQESNNKC